MEKQFMRKKKQPENPEDSSGLLVSTESVDNEIAVDQENKVSLQGLIDIVNNLDNESQPYSPSTYFHNGYGLKNGVNYIFNEDGTVNWRAMVKPEHLYPNKDRFPEGKVPDSIEGLDDSKLLIKLAGIKEVAKLRGYSKVSLKTIASEPDRAVVSCKIKWDGNYETNFERVSFEDIANATEENCNSFGKKFLEPIAFNRAFIRCVRNFLNIHIVGEDEIDKSDKTDSADNSVAISPQDVLAKNAKAKKMEDFEQFKNFLRKLWADGSYKNEEVTSWKSFKDIPPKESRILLALLNKFEQS